MFYKIGPRSALENALRSIYTSDLIMRFFIKNIFPFYNLILLETVG